MNLKNISKQRILHEVREFLVVFLFVAPFVFSIASYRLYFRVSESPFFRLHDGAGECIRDRLLLWPPFTKPSL